MLTQFHHIGLVEPHLRHTYGKFVGSFLVSDIEVAASEQLGFCASLDVVMTDSKNGGNGVSVAFANVVIEETLQIRLELHHELSIEIHDVVPPESGQ